MNKKMLLIIFLIPILFVGIKVNAEEDISGTFNIVSKLDSNKVIDLSGGSIRDGSNINLYQITTLTISYKTKKIKFIQMKVRKWKY